MRGLRRVKLIAVRSIRSKINLLFLGSSDRSAIEVTKTAKTDVVGITDNNVIEDFDLEKLPGSNEIAGDFDVWLRTALAHRSDDCAR